MFIDDIHLWSLFGTKILNFGESIPCLSAVFIHCLRQKQTALGSTHWCHRWPHGGGETPVVRSDSTACSKRQHGNDQIKTDLPICILKYKRKSWNFPRCAGYRLLRFCQPRWKALRFPIYFHFQKNPKKGRGLRMSEMYPLVNSDNYGKSPFWMGKSTISGHFQ